MRWSGVRKPLLVRGGQISASAALPAELLPVVLLHIDALDALPPLARDLACAGVCAVGAAGWIALWSSLAVGGAVSSTLSRKMVHVGSAPLFMLVWPLFSAAPSARLLAAAIPLLNAVRLVRASIASPAAGGGASEKGLVTAVSRTGDRAEVLQGPFYYVLALLVATLLSWRGSPVGVIALCQMAVGDGVADIVGRRLGAGNRWSFAPTKSVIGSAAFVAGAAVASLGILSWLRLWGCMGALPADCAARVLTISVACAAVELLPSRLLDDNISVPLLGAALAVALFGFSP